MLFMLQLLVSNIYAQVTPDKIVPIIFDLKIDKICQIFFRQYVKTLFFVSVHL